MMRDVVLAPNSEGTLMRNGPSLPVDLGRDVRLERMAPDQADAIMDACEPRGHNFSPRGKCCHHYAFVRENPPPEPPYGWDSDARLQECVALSRLIRPTSIGFEYSARVECTAGGDLNRIIPGAVRGFGAERWIVPTSHGDYLDQSEVTALAELWRNANLASLPLRLWRAMWYHEYAFRSREVAIRWILITTAIEALINIGPERVSKQFTVRFPALAGRFAGMNVSRTRAGEAYGLRCQISHGTTLENLRNDHLELYSTLEGVLRATLRAGMASHQVQCLFSSDEAVGQEWPIEKLEEAQG